MNTTNTEQDTTNRASDTTNRASDTTEEGRAAGSRYRGEMPRDSIAARVRTRVPAVGAAAATVALGLGLRACLPEVPGKIAGDALYTVLLYTIVLTIRPTARPLHAGAIALGASFAMEFFQLTPIPAWLSSQHVLLRLIFGTTFGFVDLASYVLGAALATGVHVGARSVFGNRPPA
jgi:hypothetical protein